MGDDGLTDHFGVLFDLVDAEDKVVVDDGHLVLGEHHVELDHLSAAHVRLAERRDRVLHERGGGQRAGVERLAHAAVADGYARTVEVVVVVLGDQRVGRLAQTRDE